MAWLTEALYGAIIGLALGLTGGGGSIITLPILVYLVGETVHDAIGTSLAVVGGIALQGIVGQRARVDWKTGVTLGGLGLLGSVPASVLAQRVPDRVLLLLFAAVMLVAAVAMLRMKRVADEAERRPPRLAVALVGISLGFLTGFLGVGGGFLIVPTLMLALRFSMQRAIPTSLLVITLNSIASLAARTAVSGIEWHLVALFLAGGLVGNYVGAAGAQALDQRRLKQIFAVFVIAVGLFTGGSAMGIIPVRVH